MSSDEVEDEDLETDDVPEGASLELDELDEDAEGTFSLSEDELTLITLVDSTLSGVSLTGELSVETGDESSCSTET